MTTRLRDVLTKMTCLLAQAGIDTPARDARALMARAVDKPADRLTLMLDDPIDLAAQSQAEALAVRRGAREPLSHIIGTRQFFEHVFRVSPDVLDPRPETECLVRAALDGAFTHVLDLGTGSGCILLSLLAARSASSGIGTDVSFDALEVAMSNAAAIGVEQRAMFLQSDWFSAVEGRFDLIVSNPPYIAAQEMTQLAPELAYEPRLALTDDGDGLSAYRQIVPQAKSFLEPGGRIILEVGWRQGQSVARMMQDAGYGQVRIRPDLDGRDRVVEATLG
ncbi:MAG: peptide chain release factor N(5)-glutamine methyltransferase [Pseudomonadota bacterium]